MNQSARSWSPAPQSSRVVAGISPRSLGGSNSPRAATIAAYGGVVRPTGQVIPVVEVASHRRPAHSCRQPEEAETHAFGTPLCQDMARARVSGGGRGVRDVASSKSRCRGQVDRAGVTSRPRSPTRARFFSSVLVLEHADEHDIGETPFQSARRHHRGHPGGFAMVVVGAGVAGVALMEQIAQFGAHRSGEPCRRGGRTWHRTRPGSRTGSRRATKPLAPLTGSVSTPTSSTGQRLRLAVLASYRRRAHL